MAKREVWIGLVHYSYLNQKGYSQVLTFVKNEEEFISKVHKVFSEYEMVIFDIEDIERVSARLKNVAIDDYLIGYSKEIEQNTNFTKIGDFHTYPDIESN